MSRYGMHKDVALSYDEAVERVREELGKEGFGVLTEIDVKSTLKKKLDADFRKYVILGACNPALAHRALGADLEVGVLLPCNVCVYEREEGGAHVTAMDPTSVFGDTGEATLDEVAREVRSKIERVLEAL